eukprot:GHVL01006248.1.p1 GENE.GHVL01006248.1~~GHVL01006248.1.p1  ORF type:complete len:262 (+),score=29.19 GHVL01006248.1:260-1045(+)
MMKEVIFWMIVLLSETEKDCSCEMELENGAERKADKTDSEGTCVEQEPKQCSQTMALVPYNEESLPILFKPERQFTFLGHTLTIRQDWGNRGVAAVVWDAAIVLGEHLEKHQDIVRNRHVLELGAGTGLVGIVAALAGGEVTCTERAEALDHLRATVSSNLNGHRLEVKELDWTHDHSYLNSDYDVILGADIVYIEDTFPDLLRTLLHFAGPDTKVLLSCKIRYQRDSKFLTMLKEHFHISKVHFDLERDIYIYAAKKTER